MVGLVYCYIELALPRDLKMLDKVDVKGVLNCWII